MAQDRQTLTPEEAAAALVAARGILRQSRRAAVGSILRSSLVFWGLNWMVGYTLFQLWPGWPAIVLWALVSLGLYTLPRLRIADAELIVSGWEAHIRRAWWVVLAGSCACAVIAAPAPLTVLLLLSGAVWGIAYALYGVIAGDEEIAALGGAIVVLAVALRLLAPAVALALFGLGAGGAQVLLGLLRLRRR